MIDVPQNILILLLIIIGASFGSFLNVVILRVPKKMSLIKPSSRCTSCDQAIKPYDKIPILSYFLLSGKCRHCENSFSIQYPLVECLTAIITVTLYIIYGLAEKYLMYLILSYILIAITFIDIEHFIIPNGFILFGLAILAIGLFMNWLPIDWIESVSGAFVFGGFLFAIGLIGQFILKKESIGFGDVKLGLVLGGFLGVEYSVLALYLSFAISAIIVFLMLGSKMISKSQKIPFGPYLAGGSLLTLITTDPLGGNAILNWYYITMF